MLLVFFWALTGKVIDCNKCGSRLSNVSRYELKHAKYVTKLPKGKHSTKGNACNHCRIVDVIWFFCCRFLMLFCYSILHSLICRVLLLLLMLLRNASDLRNCTSYFGACMRVWYCRPPIGAHFHPTPNPHPFPSNWGRKRIYVLWQQF